MIVSGKWYSPFLSLNTGKFCGSWLPLTQLSSLSGVNEISSINGAKRSAWLSPLVNGFNVRPFLFLISKWRWGPKEKPVLPE